MKKRHIGGLFHFGLADFGFLIIFMCMVYGWSTNETKDTTQMILNGIPNYGELEILLMGKWLFLLSIFFFMLCRKQAKLKPIQGFILYRKQYFNSWWRQHFWKQYGYFAFGFWISVLLWHCMDLCRGITEFGCVGEVLFFFLHLSVYMSGIIVCDFVCEKNILPCILIVFEGMLYVLSVDYRLPALAWGMYVHCAFSKIGFLSPVLCVIKTVLILGWYASIPVFWKYRIIERKV